MDIVDAYTCFVINDMLYEIHTYWAVTCCSAPDKAKSHKKHKDRKRRHHYDDSRGELEDDVRAKRKKKEKKHKHKHEHRHRHDSHSD